MAQRPRRRHEAVETKLGEGADGHRLLADHGVLGKRRQVGRRRPLVAAQVGAVGAQRIDGKEEDVGVLGGHVRRGVVVGSKKRAIEPSMIEPSAIMALAVSKSLTVSISSQPPATATAWTSTPMRIISINRSVM